MVKQNLLTKLLLLFALIVGSVSSVWADDPTGNTTLALSTDAISFTTPFSSAPSSYPSSVTNADLSGSDGNMYVWSFLYASGSSTKLQIKSKEGVLTSPTITSSNGFTITITYTFSSDSDAQASIKIGNEDAVTSTSAGTLTAKTESSSASVVITAPGKRALYITKIEITPEGGDEKTSTTTTIDASGITNTNLYVSNTAGKLSATVKAGEDIINNAPITWSSSATSVATVDAEGNVTLKAVGTTTLKATYAGDDTYNGSSATYELTVENNDPNVLTATFEMGANQYNWPYTSDGNTYYDGSDYNATEGHITIGFSGKVRLWYGSNTYTMRFYSDDTYGRGTLFLTADEGYVMTGVSISGTTLSFQNPSIGEINGGEWTGSAKELSIEKGKSTSTFTTVKVTYKRETVTITPASGLDYISFSSTKALDFTDVEGLTAFVVSADGTSSVTLSPVMKVPANTGLVLKKTGEEDRYDVPVLSGDADTFTNLLVGTADGPKPVQPREVYVLNGGKFKLFTGTEIPQGKAYLPATTGAPALDLDFGEGTTGIQNIERTVNDNQYYTLDGRRVAQPTKGLYIVNGKKVIIK